MKTRLLRLALVLVGLAWVAGPAEAVSIGLRPSAPLTGGPGAIVGWGYEIVNDDLDRDLVEVLDFGALVTSGSGSVLLDVFDFPSVPAGQTLVVDYDGLTGLVALQLPADGPGIVTGEVFGTLLLVASSPLGDVSPLEVPFLLPFAAEVVPLPEVPEPATLLLIASGAVVLHRRARRGE